jgi:ABC-type bacteriocin/lantibiotic exporter with double-glycine peptidase domain
MRADQPEIDLLLFDEPVRTTNTPAARNLMHLTCTKTSSLDAHAQNKVFDTIKRISRSDSGEPTKTVIFITHRLSTARRADKIAMMDNGVLKFYPSLRRTKANFLTCRQTIKEFGSHDELLSACGSYAALYRASV